MNIILLVLGWLFFALAFTFDGETRSYLNGAALGLFIGSIAVAIESAITR